MTSRGRKFAASLIVVAIAASWTGSARASQALATDASIAPPAVMKGQSSSLDFVAADLDGGTFHGSSLAGKVVLLDFWAVWCAPCIDAIPKLNTLQAELGDLGFEVVGVAVNSGPVEDVRTFARKHGMEYRVVVGDNDLVYDYDVIGYPTYYLIDRAGRQIKKYVGALPDLAQRIEADARALLSTSHP